MTKKAVEGKKDLSYCIGVVFVKPKEIWWGCSRSSDQGTYKGEK